jgi:gliding motility-associated-like protein
MYAFPEAFTPSNGGLNNSFYIITNGSSNVVLKEFRIYNRWGELVHSTPVPWNGTVGGTEQPQDTYVFSAVVEITSASGVVTETVNGAFTLLR